MNNEQHPYNAAEDLVLRNLPARAEKAAYIDDHGELSYQELAERMRRFGSALLGFGLQPEDRVMIVMHDSVDWPVAFLGCLFVGLVPVAGNTLLTPRDYAFMLSDCRAKALIVSEALLPMFQPLLSSQPFLRHVVVSGDSFSALLRTGHPDFPVAKTIADDPAFWLYSSGSTGLPKGVVHAHGSLAATAEQYAQKVLGIQETDVVFSAAKLFFAYGLGNALTFPLFVGATAVLMAERPTPKAVFERLTKHKPTIFYGVPTLYAALLAHADFPTTTELALRICTSAGEALPAELGRRWTERTGVEILDGIGSTEMLHIFVSNLPGDVCYGASGRPVPGYRVKILDEQGKDVQANEIGDLYVSGPSSALHYARKREMSQKTFLGEWVKTGDKYSFSPEGIYTYAGRSDDMLKVSGIYVSPFEVEAALLTHPAVLEAAVVGHRDDAELVKPKAFVVLRTGFSTTRGLAAELAHHVKEQLAPYKYPRWIEFVAELPKTATGKIQRFKLRAK